MKNISNKNKDALKDRKLCLLNKQGNRIIIKIGPNTTLTALRDFIKKNSSEIKKIQSDIRDDTNTNKTERDRYKDKRWRDWLIWDYSKKPIEELRQMIKGPINREAATRQTYKSEIIATIINQDIKPYITLEGKEEWPTMLTGEHVRKIISRQKRLHLKEII